MGLIDDIERCETVPRLSKKLVDKIRRIKEEHNGSSGNQTITVVVSYHSIDKQQIPDNLRNISNYLATNGIPFKHLPGNEQFVFESSLDKLETLKDLNGVQEIDYSNFGLNVYLGFDRTLLTKEKYGRI